MTPYVWRILCLRNSSSFRQPSNLPTAARRNRKCTECGATAFGRNRMSAESAHLSTFGAETETEAEILSTSSCFIQRVGLVVLVTPSCPSLIRRRCCVSRPFHGCISQSELHFIFAFCASPSSAKIVEESRKRASGRSNV